MNDLDQYYKVLELLPGASREEISQAYKDLAFIWHPDRIPKDNPRLLQKAEQKIKEINQAREQLRSIQPRGQNQNVQQKHTQHRNTQQQNTQYRNTQQQNTQHKHTQHKHTQHQNTQQQNTQQQHTQHQNTQQQNTQQQNTQYRNTQYPNTQYPNTQYRNTQYPNTQHKTPSHRRQTHKHPATLLKPLQENMLAIMQEILQGPIQMRPATNRRRLRHLSLTAKLRRKLPI